MIARKMQPAIRARGPCVDGGFDAEYERRCSQFSGSRLHGQVGRVDSPALTEEVLADRDPRIDRPLTASKAVRARLGHLLHHTAQETQLFGSRPPAADPDGGVVVVLDAGGEFPIPHAFSEEMIERSAHPLKSTAQRETHTRQ
jgi:hypothetical protein